MLEIHGISRSSPGGTTNEDALDFGLTPVPHAVVCDGTGQVGGAGSRACRLFGMLFSSAHPGDLGKPRTWQKWISEMDSDLVDIGESTFLGCAVLGNRVCGCFAGDSRAYLQRSDGAVRILTDSSSKMRLGTGRAWGEWFESPFGLGDRLFLMSDGVWTPFESPERMGNLLLSKVLLPTDRFLEGILDDVIRTGHQDDMTIIAVIAASAKP